MTTMTQPESAAIKLSVIVPLYNAGAMFHIFMSSLLAQTLTDLEIILVNDGSTGGSEVLAWEYTERHPHVRVIDQANGGVSRARNAGLATARGVYVTFPDADDMLYPTFYQPAAGDDGEARGSGCGAMQRRAFFRRFTAHKDPDPS